MRLGHPGFADVFPGWRTHVFGDVPRSNHLGLSPPALETGVLDAKDRIGGLGTNSFTGDETTLSSREVIHLPRPVFINQEAMKPQWKHGLLSHSFDCHKAAMVGKPCGSSFNSSATLPKSGQWQRASNLIAVDSECCEASFHTKPLTISIPSRIGSEDGSQISLRI